MNHPNRSKQQQPTRTPDPYLIRNLAIEGERDRLKALNAELLAALKRYVGAYPAFRMKPIGAPGSEKRIEQENLMALEDAANAVIAKADGK